MKNIFNPFSLFFCGILFFTACSNNTAEPIEIGDNEIPAGESVDDIIVTQSQFDLANMQLGKMKDHSFATTIRATGRVKIPSKNHTRVSSYAGGYITNINLIPGEKVAKGQVLFTLENPEFVQMQQDYLEAKEQLTYLKSDYERQKTLANENIASQKNHLKAESEYRVTLARMEGMKKRLSLIKIKTENISVQNLQSSISVYAPMSGYITAVFAMKGMFLNPTDVALEILNTEHIQIELNVFEKDILKIKKGQAVQFRIPDASAETYHAEVHLIGKSVDEEKRVVRVLAHLKNEKDKALLVAGMYVEAEIITQENKTKGLPESAIVSEDGKNYVLIQKSANEEVNKFEKKEVTPGQRKDGFVQIINHTDFSGEESVLINGAFNLIGIE